jgi:chaperonin GroES
MALIDPMADQDPMAMGGGAMPMAQQQQAPIQPELQNIAESLDEDSLRDIGQQCMEEFEADEASRQEWLEMHAHWVRLYFQKDKAENPPWQGSSQESMPIVTEACNQFHARAFKALFPNRSIIKAIPVGNVRQRDMDRADRVAKHMSFQLLVRDKTYKRRKDALLLGVAVHGSVFTQTYWNPFTQMNCTENVRAVDFVVPYGVGPREMEDIDRKSKIVYKSVNDTKIMAASGYFLSPCKPYTKGKSDQYQDSVDEIEGASEAQQHKRYWCKVIEQHRLLDLDGDGIEEPYIVSVDAEDSSVKRISIRYETDEFGNPVGGSWYDLKRPIEYFDHWMFLPNPDGFYGLGMGHLVGNINTAVNKLLRQTIDAGTLANMSTGFVDSSIGIPGGELEMQMGRFRKVNGGGRIADHIMHMQFPGPSPAIMQTMEMLGARGDRLATVTEALTGQMDKVQQPTVVLSLVEQGLEVFSTVYERLIIAWESELNKHFKLNRKYMPETEYVTVMDLPGLEMMQVSKLDYADDYQITPIADPKMATEQQKLTRAMAEWQFLSTNPLVLQSPWHFYKASERYLKSIEVQNINEVLPQPAVPGRVDDPVMENMAALMPQPVMPMVFPDQDHLTHMQVHDSMFSDEVYGPLMSPAGVQALMLHIQMHKAYAYGTTESPMMGQMIGQVGNPTMAPAPGHVLVPPGALGGGMAQGGAMGGGSDMGGGGGASGEGASSSQNKGSSGKPGA